MEAGLTLNDDHLELATSRNHRRLVELFLGWGLDKNRCLRTSARQGFYDITRTALILGADTCQPSIDRTVGHGGLVQSCGGGQTPPDCRC